MNHRLIILAACLVAFFSTVGAALPYPILAPLFAADVANPFNHFGGLPPKLLLGVALAVNPVGLLVGSALLGPLSDRFGRRPLLMGTAAGAALGHAVTAGALLLQSYPLFIVARFATGLMEGNGSVARALLADALEGPARVRAFSWLNSAFYMGWLAGPLIAALTLGWGMTAPFWLASTALILSVALTAVAVPRASVRSAVVGDPAGPSWWQVARREHALALLAHAEIRTLFWVQLAFTCGVTAFYEFYPLWLVEVMQMDARGIAWVTAALCGVMTLASVAAGRVHRPHPLQSAALFAFLGAASILAVALGQGWLGVLAIVLFGWPNAGYNAVMPAWCAERFGHLGQGAVMGLLSTIFCLANILMAATGAVLTLVDTRLILVLGAALSATAAWRIRRWSGAPVQTLRAPQA
jgi:DHA1 family tetracycline resistance protein-like MFS transporter